MESASLRRRLEAAEPRLRFLGPGGVLLSAPAGCVDALRIGRQASGFIAMLAFALSAVIGSVAAVGFVVGLICMITYRLPVYYLS